MSKASSYCHFSFKKFTAFKYWSLLIADIFSSLPCLQLKNLIFGNLFFWIPNEQAACLFILFHCKDKLYFAMLFVMSKFLSSSSGYQFKILYIFLRIYYMMSLILLLYQQTNCGVQKSKMLKLYRFLRTLVALYRILMIHFQAVEADSSQTSHKSMVHETTLVLQDCAPLFRIGRFLVNFIFLMLKISIFEGLSWSVNGSLWRY